MKTIVLLCGADRSGKTNTLKRFFGVSGRLKPNQLLKRDFNGKSIYAVSTSSPQELKVLDVKAIYAVSASSPQEQEQFCKVESVKIRIQKRIEKVEKASKGRDYILILPFGIYAKKGTSELNERCILEPIAWLKSKRFKILAIYLRKQKTAYIGLKNALMKRITKHVIESNKDYDR